MTDQRTLKKIISEQRDEIKSLQVTYQALYDLYQEVTNKIEKLENQKKEVEAVLEDYFFPKIFRDGRRGIRDRCGKEPCADCYIDQNTCLQKHQLFERISIALNYQSKRSKESV